MYSVDNCRVYSSRVEIKSVLFKWGFFFNEYFIEIQTNAIVYENSKKKKKKILFYTYLPKVMGKIFYLILKRNKIGRVGGTSYIH